MGPPSGVLGTLRTALRVNVMAKINFPVFQLTGLDHNKVFPLRKQEKKKKEGKEGGRKGKRGRDTYTLRPLDIETDGARLGPAVLSVASPACLSQRETLRHCCH